MRQMLLIGIFLCAGFLLGCAQDEPIVMFRLQGIQSYWCLDMVKTVVDEFLASNVPINLALIGKPYVEGSTTYSLSDDQALANYLAFVAPSPLIEMTSNSFQNIPYAGKTITWIETDLNNSKLENEHVTGKIPTAVVPPQGLYDLASMVALARVDMNVISSECVWSETPGTAIYCNLGAKVSVPNIKYPNTDIFMLPAGAVLGEYSYWTDALQPANVTAAILFIERQIANQGFAVVRLLPYEFATDLTCDTLDSAKVQALKDLIQYGLGKWRFKLFQEAKFLLSDLAPTASPTDSEELRIPKNGQCGGVDYTGITECRTGLVCVRESNWFSSCRRVRPTRAPVPNSPTNPPEPTRTPMSFPSAEPSVSLSPTKSPQTMSPTIFVEESISWRTIPGYSYGNNTHDNPKEEVNFIFYDGPITTENNMTECQSSCTYDNGCDFVVYYSITKKCHHKWTDKAAYVGMQFKEQSSGHLHGYLWEFNHETTTLESTIAASREACHTLCQGNVECHYVTFDTRATSDVDCKLMAFNVVDPTASIGYREAYRELNSFPARKGRFDVIGNSGVVAISASLMPTGKILMVARPEYWRGGPNTDNLSPNSLRALQVPYGEIASIFDPVSGLHTPSEIDDNIFCHGIILAEDGRLFTAGGDDGGGMNRDASTGLGNGLRNVRYFNPQTEDWHPIPPKLQVTRWYPTIVRTTTGGYWIMGGLADGTDYVPQNSMEFYQPDDTITTKFQPNRVLVDNLMASYPFATIIPQTGHVFFFAAKNYQVFDADSGVELDREVWTPGETNAIHGVRTGDFPGGPCLLPMREDPVTRYVKAEFMVFGGVDDYYNHSGLRDAARLVITDGVGEKEWIYEEELMPYSRLVIDSVIYPNGKILLINGGRNGMTGGQVGESMLRGAANDIFVYDPEAPSGERYSVLERSPFQRFYHSTAILVPDGRVLIMGTDQMTFVYEEPKASAYNHVVEAFTPPWLLDGTPRPLLMNYPSTMKYGSVYNISFSGNVDKVSLMSAQSNTHAAEMTQRLFFPTILAQSSTTLTIRAPDNPTVMIQGYHMLFIVNGNTPSIGKWITLSE